MDITFSEWLGLVVLVGFGVILAELCRWLNEEGGK